MKDGIPERLDAEREAGYDRDRREDRREERRRPERSGVPPVRASAPRTRPPDFREAGQPSWPGPVPAPGKIPHPPGDAEDDAEQPGARRAVADPRTDLVEPVAAWLDSGRNLGQGPPQCVFKTLVLG